MDRKALDLLHELATLTKNLQVQVEEDSKRIALLETQVLVQEAFMESNLVIEELLKARLEAVEKALKL
jgi:hypothetical protein